MELLLKPFRWAHERIKHKLGHFTLDSLKQILKKHGLALLVIFVMWEIIEDVLFPILFLWLGANVDPWFYTGAPASWLLCLHPIVVPAVWWLWIKVFGKKGDSAND